MASATGYTCASFVNSGKAACDNNARVSRNAAERAVLEGVRRDLSAPTVAAEFLRRVRARLGALSKDRKRRSASANWRQKSPISLMLLPQVAYADLPDSLSGFGWLK